MPTQVQEIRLYLRSFFNHQVGLEELPGIFLIKVTRSEYSGNTGRLNRNLCYVEIYPAAQKILLSLKGISSFAGNFVVMGMKQKLIWFNLQRD